MYTVEEGVRRWPAGVPARATDQAFDVTPQGPVPVADLIVATLRSAGVEVVFGVPGGATLPLLASLEKAPDMDFVLTAHEGGAAYMADCYARAGRRLGVCSATTGPGASNLLTGVAAAYVDSVPLLVITGMNPRASWGLGDFQESTSAFVDTVALFAPVTKSSEVVIDARQVELYLRRAIIRAQAGRPGPVHLAIPRDVLTTPVRLRGWRAPVIPVDGPDPDTVAAVYGHLRAAQSPLVVIGSGCARQAAEPLALLSHRLALPLVTTPRAKGMLSDTNARYLLGTTGIAGARAVDDWLDQEAPDVVLALGTGLGSYATNAWDPRFAGRMLIQVDRDADAIGRSYPVDLGIVSDAGRFVAALAGLAGQETVGVEPALERRMRLTAASARHRDRLAQAVTRVTGGSRLHPVEVVAAVDAVLPVGSLVMTDSSSLLLWVTHYLPEVDGREFIAVWGSASMGHVTAGAVGAKRANRHRALLALVGDGCFLMNGMEVATAVEQCLPVVWVINVNRQLGMIHYEQRASGLTASSTLGEATDFVAIARGLGASACEASSPGALREALTSAFSHHGPTVIVVPVDPGPTPPLGRKKEGGLRWNESLNAL